jgi:hypothetical protein
MNLYAYKICFYFSGYFFKKLEKVVEILFVLSKIDKKTSNIKHYFRKYFLNKN